MFLFSACYRHSLFGNSFKMIDSDLSRLYTATSLMQIDDNIMRYVVIAIVLMFQITDLRSLNVLICVLLVTYSSVNAFVGVEDLKYEMFFSNRFPLL